MKRLRRFAPELKQAIVLSKSVADQYNCLYLDDILLLIGLLKSDVIIQEYLSKSHSINIAVLENHIKKGDFKRENDTISMSLIAESILHKSIFECYLTNQIALQPVHVLLSLLRHRYSASCKVLERYGLNYEVCLQEYYRVNYMDEKAFKRKWSNRLNSSCLYENMPFSWLSFLIRYF